ncbi:sugar ABC transporter ATP-binding protein [Caproiciproducens sp. CPB-2]|uniref:sugar ABC transporter ATP-binding protein n=1 Tax=Caproiciproducens sp. CPB-2 TaxID=3030017 RepID=UPI0023DC543A|nr:ATP-binding cassette domain-containing protein [Caproiciproducens sp. CPB-2]MDF1494379.1 ATP-binding cassette domain-containing protein [Caproiciproducens sp. CPB-2]
MAETYMLEMTGICKSFPGVQALDEAQLKVRKGTVHALCGENGAGKSTLMKCLFGIYNKDSGSIKLDGREVAFKDTKHAIQNGIAMVHQELNQVLQRSIAENIWLGQVPRTRTGLVDQKKMYRETKRIFEDLEIDIDPRRKIGTLSVSARQMVEIARAVSNNIRLLVLDEPTSSLADDEVKQLFRIINKLRERGVGIIYISHKMEEVLKIADDVTIMRDGKWITTEKAENLTLAKIINLMVGRKMDNRFPPKVNKPGEVIMSVEHLTSTYMPGCIDVSFDLRAGEILGIAGLVGSRRTELLETVFGTRRHSEGTIKVHGREIRNNTSRDALKNGFAMLTEERRASGIFGVDSVMFNSVIANVRAYRKGLFLKQQKMKEDTDWVISSMNIKTPSQKTHIKFLSGGNQQKVIIGRWLLTKPEILLMDEPTRGIDVGAKYEIYQLIGDVAKQGKAVIVVSSEMSELLGISDRIAVMSNGHLAGILDMENATQERIMELALHFI